MTFENALQQLIAFEKHNGFKYSEPSAKLFYYRDHVNDYFYNGIDTDACNWVRHRLDRYVNRVNISIIPVKLMNTPERLLDVSLIPDSFLDCITNCGLSYPSINYLAIGDFIISEGNKPLELPASPIVKTVTWLDLMKKVRANRRIKPEKEI